MRRVLVVDDDIRELSRLRADLQEAVNEWDVVFATSGREALVSFSLQPFDVVVADAVMPGMDGSALLGHVREEFPGAIRILMGSSGQDSRALRVAHQLVAKPCPIDELCSTVERTARLQDLLQDPALRAVVGGIDNLPSAPRTYAALTEAMSDPDVPVSVLARIVERDTAITAKVLQLVNSAFYGLPRRTSQVAEAIPYIGLRQLKSLVLSLETLQGFAAGGHDAVVLVERFQRNGLRIGGAARAILRGTGLEADAFTAGLMHDVGRLALATRRSEDWSRIVKEHREAGVSLREAEFLILGVTHAEVGAALLGMWGLPTPVVEAVGCHHAPAEVSPNSFDLPGSLHVAEALVHGLTGGDDPYADIDVAYLETCGMADRLDGWRDAVAAQLETE